MTETFQGSESRTSINSRRKRLLLRVFSADTMRRPIQKSLLTRPFISGKRCSLFDAFGAYELTLRESTH